MRLQLLEEICRPEIIVTAHRDIWEEVRNILEPLQASLEKVSIRYKDWGRSDIFEKAVGYQGKFDLTLVQNVRIALGLPNPSLSE